MDWGVTPYKNIILKNLGVYPPYDFQVGGVFFYPHPLYETPYFPPSHPIDIADSIAKFKQANAPAYSKVLWFTQS